MQVTGAVQWRAPGLVYKKNEVYLDIVESISVLISPSGQVLRSSATGVIQMKTFLSGMPELTIGLNDRLGAEGGAGGGAGGGDGEGQRAGRVKKSIDLADLQFHQCVNLSKFDSEKVISFTPPDGEFDLMKFRVTDTVSLPFKVMPLVRDSPTRGSRWTSNQVPLLGEAIRQRRVGEDPGPEAHRAGDREGDRG